MQNHMPIPLLVPDVPGPEDLLPYLRRIHEARHYSNFGPLVCELEAELSSRFHALAAGPVSVVAVSSATLGLELALQALDLPPRSRVLLPALTFVATATAILRAGHLPVLADVDPDTWLLTPEIARAACRETAVDAVMPVATFGMPHAMQDWQHFEETTGLPVIVDAAGAYGSQWLTEARGTLVFSLHATKSLPAGEGGLVVSTRPELVAKVRQLSNFGINLDPTAGLPVGCLAGIGTNAKMSEFHAAVALGALARWESRALERRRLFAELRAAFDAVAGGRLRWQSVGPAGGVAAPTLMCLRLPGAEQRDRLELACHRARVSTRRWYQPLLSQMGVLEQYCILLEAPQAQTLAQDLIGLPFFLGMTDQQRARTMGAVAEVFEFSPAL